MKVIDQNDELIKKKADKEAISQRASEYDALPKKKDGTPDMRYKESKEFLEKYGSSTRAEEKSK